MSTPDNYYSTIKDFKETQGIIRKEISNLRQTTVNITTTVMKLEKRISEHKAKVIKYKEAYLARESNQNKSVTQKENIMRLNTIESFITDSDRFQEEVEQIQSNKFKYDKRPEDYTPSQEVLNLSKADYLMYQQRKLNSHDELIDSMLGIATENTKIGKEIKGTLTNQIVKIEKINEDLETTTNRVQKTNKRFENYLETTSYWKLYALIIIQFLLILFLLFF